MTTIHTYYLSQVTKIKFNLHINQFTLGKICGI